MAENTNKRKESAIGSDERKVSGFIKMKTLIRFHCCYNGDDGYSSFHIAMSPKVIPLMDRIRNLESELHCNLLSGFESGTLRDGTEHRFRQNIDTDSINKHTQSVVSMMRSNPLIPNQRFLDLPSESNW